MTSDSQLSIGLLILLANRIGGHWYLLRLPRRFLATITGTEDFDTM